MVASEPTIEEFSTVLELDVDTEPPPAKKLSIKPGYWKVVVDRILKLELYRVSIKVVISGFSKQILSVQQDFNLLYGKLNDLKTDAKVSRV